MASDEPKPSGGRRRRRVLTTLAAVLIVVAVLAAGLEVVQTRSPSSNTNEGTLPTGGLGYAPAVCTDLTPTQELANQKAESGAGSASPAYDEQMWLDFAQNFTGGISYNVTLRAQNDSSGYGPVYLLNGRTGAGYWYQVGVGWDFALGSGTHFLPGFGFLYEVWDAATSSPVFPAAAATLPQSFDASPGDVVLLSLSFSSGQVAMSAVDWNTSARAEASYDAYGASSFVALSPGTSGYPTSLVTEWYHVLPYFCSAQSVVYSNGQLALSSASLRIDEWNFTGVQASAQFNSTAPGECCVFSTAAQPVSFANAGEFQYLSTNGTTVYADAHEFVTP